MKLNEIIHAMEGVQALLEKNVKASVGYELSLLIEELDKHYTLYTQKRDELAKKYGTTEDGKQYQINPENMNAFTKEMEDLLTVEIGIQANKIKLEAIKDIEIPLKSLMSLKPLLEVEKKE